MFGGQFQPHSVARVVLTIGHLPGAGTDTREMSAILLFAITWAGLPPEQALERAMVSELAPAAVAAG